MGFADSKTLVSDILLATQEDGEVRVNLGELTDGVGVGQEAAVWGPDGYLAMPNLPDDEGCAQALYSVDGHTLRVIATRDNRFAAKTPSLKPGDRAIVSDCDARIMLRKETNQIVLYTINSLDDKAMLDEIDGSTGTRRIVNSGNVIELTNDSCRILAGGCVIEMKDGTITFFATHFACNTGGGNLGVVGAIAPIPGLMSVLAGPTGMAGAPSTKWTVAT